MPRRLATTTTPAIGGRRIRHRTPALALAGAALIATTASVSTTASADASPSDAEPAVELLGAVELPTGTQFGGTEVGGISGIVYDDNADTYLALSDDRSQVDDARFYRTAIDLTDGELTDDDVSFLDVTTLRDADGEPYAPGTIDPEGITIARDGTLHISSEGDASQFIGPSVEAYDDGGRLLRSLSVPSDYEPSADGSSGIRNNLAFESLTATRRGNTLVTATENALVQDGPVATVDHGSPSRVLVLNSRGLRPKAEYVYETDPIPHAPVPPDQFADNGLVELLAIDHDTFLAMERSFAVGVGNDIRIYVIDLDNRSRLRGPRTVDDVEPLDKTLVADVQDDLGVAPDNIEAMTFGPTLPDGRRSLILVSDNNFNDVQVTQFIAVAIDLERI